MRRAILVLAVAAILTVSATLPAAAQNWMIQLRYYSTDGQWKNGGFQPTFDSNLFGLTLRTNFGGGAWSVSLNYDTGNVTNYSAGSLGGDAYNRFWNVNLHRNFTAGNTALSAYVGVGGARWQSVSGGVFIPYDVRQTGIRLGADAKIKFAGSWYVMADVGFMPSQSAHHTQWTTPVVNQSVNASLLDYRIALGYEFANHLGLEAGYRGINWTFSPTPMCLGASPCEFRWTGWYLGVNYTTP
jgi:hypothetical protein